MAKSLLGKAKIEFRTPLNSSQLQKVFRKLVKDRPYNIRFTISETFSENKNFGNLRNYEKSTGIIDNAKPEVEFLHLSFSLETNYFEDEDKSKYTKLQFFVTPGYEIEDMNLKN